MKKNFKLFSTIASLCLAVALMAFGVWAATSVNVSITGNVTFTATANVKAKVTFQDTLDNATGITPVETAETLYETKADATDATATGSKALEDMTVEVKDSSKNIVYTYTITVENKAASTDLYKFLKVELTKPAETAVLDSDGYTVAVTGDLAAGGVLAVGETKTYVVTLTINPNRNVNKADIGSSIKLTMVETNA